MEIRDNPDLPWGCRMADDLATAAQIEVNSIVQTGKDISGSAGEFFAQETIKRTLEEAGAVVRVRGCRASFILRDSLVEVDCQSADCPAGRISQ